MRSHSRRWTAPAPHMTNYPAGLYERVLGRPDEKVWNSVDNQPPVKVGAAAG